jgi:fatty acid desaturase
MKENAAYPIPYRLNIAIALIGFTLCIWILYTGSHIENTISKFGLAVLFAVLMIPLYSLIHEAEHEIMHPNKFLNYSSGVFLSLLFIAPFTFIRKCHLNHHKHNRTDYEMWDLYYEHQHKWLRQVYFYIVRLGMEWVMIVVSVILFALLPKLVFSALFSWNDEIKGIIKGANKEKLLVKIRIESYLVIAFQIGMFYLLRLDLSFLLMAYLCHGFVWSSQNYVTHAFTPRDIINGANNLKMSMALRWLYLNFNVHLAHHQYPKMPWIHLPKFVQQTKTEQSFWYIYFKLWLGPVLTQEPSPTEGKEKYIS